MIGTWQAGAERERQRGRKGERQRQRLTDRKTKSRRK